MAAVTLKALSGSTATTTCAGTANTMYVVGPPQTYTVKNFSANYPGAYMGLWQLESLIGVDGNPWYRYERDIPQDDATAIKTTYTATYEPS